MVKHPPVRIEALRSSLFHDRATVVAAHDGDTRTMDIDLGMSTWLRGEKVRLARTNAPELGGAEGRRQGWTGVSDGDRRTADHDEERPPSSASQEA